MKELEGKLKLFIADVSCVSNHSVTFHRNGIVFEGASILGSDSKAFASFGFWVLIARAECSEFGALFAARKSVKLRTAFMSELRLALRMPELPFPHSRVCRFERDGYRYWLYRWKAGSRLTFSKSRKRVALANGGK